MKTKSSGNCFSGVLRILVLAVVVCTISTSIRGQSVSYKTDGQNFSPYMDGQDPNLRTFISEQQLRNRMQIVAPYTRWIRTFGTTDGLEKAGLVARSLGLKAAIGAWIGPDAAVNEQQIANLISIANAGNCDLAIVGSEVLLRGDASEAQLIDYIRLVKQSIPAGIPVTTADVYSQLLAHPNVVSNIDVVMANFYPYWEGVRVDLAMGVLHARYADVKAAAGTKPVFVSESGWPSSGNQIGDAVPTPQNASFFFLNFVSWARANNVQYFYFESFDESWKARHEGPQGAHWGLWDKNGNLKPGMQDVFDNRTIPDNWSGGVVNCDPSIPNLRFTHVPPIGSFDNIRGQVCRVKPADFRIVVYIKVGNSWWVKPFANQPLTNILNDGSWICDITTGGFDSTATEVVAYLVPNEFSPPILLGSPSLPAMLDQSSVAKASVNRCTYSITPASQLFASPGGNGSVTVTAADSSCKWTAASNVSWITITSGGSGTGNGTVRFAVAANATSSRTGTLTIAEKTLTVTQTGPVILVSEETSTRAIAFDSVHKQREPFKLTSPIQWGVDKRTRIMLFAMNLDILPGENLSIVTADAEDASHRIYPMTVEHVSKVQGFDWLSCVIVRLNDDMGDIGDVLVRLTVRGFSSNRVRVGIGHTGGGPVDDPGAVPTPGRKPN